MLDIMENTFAKVFGILGAALVIAGSLLFNAWVVYDLMDLEGKLALSLVMLVSGSIALAAATVLERRPKSA